MPKIEFSYYSLFLKHHLQDINDARKDDASFILNCTERAETEYEGCRRDGLSVDQAHECAMSILVSGL